MPTCINLLSRLACLTLLVLASLGCANQPPAELQAPGLIEGSAPSNRRVLVVSIDGLRPDLLFKADTPALQRLVADGASTAWAQTTPMGKTLPSHTSMLTGVLIETHGITWNGTAIPADVDYRYPKVPTLFELAHQAGYSTAIAAGKAKFDTLAKPGTVDWLTIPDPESDPATTDAAVELIHAHAPQVMLLHLGDVDRVGHRDGWGTATQLDAIETADQCFARVRRALEDRGVWDQTLVIVTADHGGFGKTHHGHDPRGLHIPWIAHGPGIKPGYDLTAEKDLLVRTYDTFATACTFLGLDAPDDIDGQPVNAAFTHGKP